MAFHPASCTDDRFLHWFRAACVIVITAVGSACGGAVPAASPGREDTDGDGIIGADDCDGSDPSVHVGAPERCDGVDDDCDGVVDDHAEDAPVWYADADGDAYGDERTARSACDRPLGYVVDGTDCDDSNDQTHRWAQEICDGADNNCDGVVDEATAVGAITWYADADADGFGNPESSVVACASPEGWVGDGTDCQDASAQINVSADEVCDGLDNDCSGTVDGPRALDASTWYADLDADGFGDPENSVMSCSQPGGYVADDTDCDDAREWIFPYDSNADGMIDGCGWRAVSAGGKHSCGIDSAGEVRCWGMDTFGSTTAPLGEFLSVSAGSHNTCGIDPTGSVHCWGGDVFGESTTPSGTFSSVSAGDSHTCAVALSGDVECWGMDREGQSSPPSSLFSSVSASGSHTCGIDTTGAAQCWGKDEFAESQPPKGMFQDVRAGGDHSCVIDAAGAVQCFGCNDDGESISPSGIYVAISTGYFHNCALDTTGAAYCWGRDERGEASAPPGSFVSVSAGLHHSCAVDTDGAVQCWGSDEYGQSTPP